MRIVLGLLVACLTAGLAIAADSRKMTGTITDGMCPDGDHSHMKMGDTDSECARACNDMHGALYVLYDGKKAYDLSDQTDRQRNSPGKRSPSPARWTKRTAKFR